MHAYFNIGSIHVHDDARELCGRTPLDLVARHAVGDHGLISPRREVQNRLAMQRYGEIVSRFSTNPLDPAAPCILVRTHDGWDMTTIEIEGDQHELAAIGENARGC